MLWVVAALASSVVGGHNAELNRKYRQDGYRLNCWRSLIAALIWLPFMLIVPWPTSPWFYLNAFLAGISIFIGFTVTSNLAKDHNGRVAILHLPLKALLVFFVWLAVSEPARIHFFENMHTAIMAVVAGIIMIVALNQMRRNDVSLGVLKQVAPIVVMYGMGEIFTRLVMPADTLLERMPLYFFITYSMVFLLSIAGYKWRPKPEMPFYTPQLFKVATISGVGGIINHSLFLIALVTAPNPAFVSLICLLTPVWLMLYHKWRGIPDHADPKAGFILVLGAMLLVMATL